MNMNVGIAEILKDVIQGKEIEDSLKGLDNPLRK